jgi:hypothetical protein
MCFSISILFYFSLFFPHIVPFKDKMPSGVAHALTLKAAQLSETSFLAWETENKFRCKNLCVCFKMFVGIVSTAFAQVMHLIIYKLRKLDSRRIQWLERTTFNSLLSQVPTLIFFFQETFLMKETVVYSCLYLISWLVKTIHYLVTYIQSC